MRIRSIIKKDSKLYSLLKNIKISHENNKRLKGKYNFINRSGNNEKLCIILAGYKSIVWDDVFARIKKYLPNDIDFCVITSGKTDSKLKILCEENKWSYISTKRNCVSLAQNIAINLFPKAKYIYKLDEDIFINENLFQTLWYTYEKVSEESFYEVGFVAPIIPINGFAHTELLKYLGLVDTYTRLFERPHVSTDNDNMVVGSAEAAKFFWGEGGYVPQIDEINRMLQQEKFNYVVCPVRFSIGCIMFPRKTWEDMGMFKVESGSCLGLDETQLCEFCVSRSRVMVVSKNCLAGHLSFGPQNKEMLEYYENNRSRFSLKEYQTYE